MRSHCDFICKAHQELIPVFRLRPKSPQVLNQTPTQKYVVMLVESRIGMLYAARNFDSLEMFPVTAAIAAENDH